MDPSCYHHLDVLIGSAGASRPVRPALSRVARRGQGSTTDGSGRAAKAGSRQAPGLGTRMPLSSLQAGIPSGCRLWRRCIFSHYYRAISTARLSVSPRLHLRPIDVVVYDGPYGEI